jgi:pyrroline-5-carboxylate reductase
MKTSSLGFIGGGQTTRIILQAFANRKRDFKSIIIFDTNRDLTEALKIKFPEIEIAESIHEAARQSIVFIALQPAVIMESIEKIAGNINENSIVISLAPQITIKNIASKLRTTKIARMITNPCSYINEGQNPITFSKEFDTYDKVDLLALLMHLGNTFEVKENTLEAYTLISSMLPSYFLFQWKELLKLGSQMGLTPAEGKETIANTLEASIKLMFKSGLPVSEVMDLISEKPIADCETKITQCYEQKLMDLFEKIKP